MALFVRVADLEDIARHLRAAGVRINHLRVSSANAILEEQYVHLESGVNTYFTYRRPFRQVLLTLHIQPVSLVYAPTILYGFGDATLGYRMRYMESYQKGVESNRIAVPGYATDLIDLASLHNLEALITGFLLDKRYLSIWRWGYLNPTAPLRLLPQLVL